jgi:hypothetical protein
MKGTKHNVNYLQLTKKMVPEFSHKREKRLVKQQYRRDMGKALESMDEYEKYHGKRMDDSSLKGISREMMNIVEDISEKGSMNENQYLDMMNLLLKVHKQATEEPEVSSRGVASVWWDHPASEYMSARAAMEIRRRYVSGSYVSRED